MKKLLLLLGVFISGVSIGGYFGWTKAKEKYLKLADDEIDSVKKLYESRVVSNTDNAEHSNKKRETKKKVVSNDSIQNEISKSKVGFTDYARNYQSKDTGNRIVGTPKSENVIKPSSVMPYVITPEEFAESNYETKTLLYFSDKVLADEDYNVIYNVKDEVGEDSLTRFGEYAEDSVYVRNDRLYIDYEILLDERAFYKIQADGVDARIKEIDENS